MRVTVSHGQPSCRAVPVASAISVAITTSSAAAFSTWNSASMSAPLTSRRVVAQHSMPDFPRRISTATWSRWSSPSDCFRYPTNFLRRRRLPAAEVPSSLPHPEHGDVAPPEASRGAYKGAMWVRISLSSSVANLTLATTPFFVHLGTLTTTRRYLDRDRLQSVSDMAA